MHSCLGQPFSALGDLCVNQALVLGTAGASGYRSDKGGHTCAAGHGHTHSSYTHTAPIHTFSSYTHTQLPHTHTAATRTQLLHTHTAVLCFFFPADYCLLVLLFTPLSYHHPL